MISWKLDYLFVSNGVKTRSLDFVGVAVQSYVSQQHDGAEQQGCRVRQVSSCDVWGRSMNLAGDE